LILLVMPFTDLSRSRGIQFRPLSKIAFFFYMFYIYFLFIDNSIKLFSNKLVIGTITKKYAK